jgi:uncharacterized repeat protein (TIGR04076 family)
MSDLKIEVKEIRGHCPVYEADDSFHIVEGYKLQTTHAICMHSLTSLMPYYVALSRGIPPKELGLDGGERAYVQCLDPCEYTGGGTVVFEITREEGDE